MHYTGPARIFPYAFITVSHQLKSAALLFLLLLILPSAKAAAPLTSLTDDLPADLPIEIELGPDSSQKGEHLNIKLLTLGQGDPLYLWFGHTALVVEDTQRGTSRLYDFGVFDFSQKNFFTNFAFGRLIYGVRESSTEQRIRQAIYFRRNATMLSLNLPPEKRYFIAAYLQEKVKPENSSYLYHHYYDNCATRIRDIIDMAVDGQFKAWAADIEGETTFRGHTRRNTHRSFFLDWMLNFLQGKTIDVPISRWEEMFLPEVLEQSLLEFSYSPSQDNIKIKGQSSIPIAASRRVISSYPERKLILDKWKAQWPKGVLYGSAAALLALFTALAADRRGGISKKKFPKVFLRFHGLINVAAGLFLGSAGSALFFMTFFTDHDVTYHNQNIFFINPLYLVIAVFGVLMSFGKEKYIARTAALWRIEAVFFLVMAAMKLFPGNYQWNTLSIVLVLPLIIVQARLWTLVPDMKQYITRFSYRGRRNRGPK